MASIQDEASGKKGGEIRYLTPLVGQLKMFYNHKHSMYFRDFDFFNARKVKVPMSLNANCINSNSFFL